jgi:predicted TIM-barrel fold metal-dependent hydrolase
MIRHVIPDERLVVDACAFHEWKSSLELVPYMSEGWGRVVKRENDLMPPVHVMSNWRYEHPTGGKALDAYPEAGPPGSDRELLLEQLFAGGRRGRLVLGYHEGLLATAFPQPYLSGRAVSAANDWTIEQWLAHDERLFGMVMVASSLPEDAAAEIRRVGAHEQMVAVALGTNGLGHPFGHPAYRAIHEAAAELDLPLVIQFGSDFATDAPTAPTAAGVPSTYGEYDVHAAQALMGHAASLIFEGVFDLFPNLRVLLVGGGAAWVPWAVWNFDYHYMQTRRLETPWLRMAPSEYFARFVRVSTYQLEAPEGDRLEQALTTLPELESMLMYASGYPNADWEQPEAVAARLPEAWHRRVFQENAEEFFRWPGRERSETITPLSKEEVTNLQ